MQESDLKWRWRKFRTGEITTESDHEFPILTNLEMPPADLETESRVLAGPILETESRVLAGPILETESRVLAGPILETFGIIQI